MSLQNILSPNNLQVYFGSTSIGNSNDTNDTAIVSEKNGNITIASPLITIFYRYPINLLIASTFMVEVKITGIVTAGTAVGDCVIASKRFLVKSQSNSIGTTSTGLENESASFPGSIATGLTLSVIGNTSTSTLDCSVINLTAGITMKYTWDVTVYANYLT